MAVVPGTDCLSLNRVDRQQVGIVYEVSGLHLVFEKASIVVLLKR